jgi:thymidine kinase
MLLKTSVSMVIYANSGKYENLQESKHRKGTSGIKTQYYRYKIDVRQSKSFSSHRQTRF